MSDARDTRDTRDTRKDPSEVDDAEKTQAGGLEVEREPITSATPMTAAPGRGADMWPDMTDLRERFDALQSEFIEDPKGAVKKAEGLINDVVERLTRSLHERMDSMHHGAEGSDDTEQLRQTMRGYRDLVVWMETHRAA